MATLNEVVINRATLSDQVYEYLRGEILTGRFLPGERLDLGELVERLKVSKMPVKEAIARLSTEGLLDVQAQRGTFVSRVEPRELEETFAVRCALEVLAGELAVARITKSDLEKLNQLITEMEQSTSLTDVGRHLELNFQFHGLLVELSDNRKLIEMYHRLKTPIQIAGIHYRSETWVERVAKEQKEHRAIVRALEQKDTEAVSRAIREHIKRGGASLLEDVERSVGQE
ncbi:MAG TPA: GntR family transcriptional regulator [Blastocatellia bacterium]|nr:GntR family transcriptional regulator [Blastocatellia bacterium]